MIDQYRDPALAVLIRLIDGRPKLAAEIGETDIDAEELSTLSDTAFAWPEKRAFPIHTRDHAILSRVYRENSTGVPAHVDEAIKEACDVYGVDDALFVRTKQAASVDAPEDYLLPDHRRIPVRSAAQVKLAEEKLAAEYTKLAVETRAVACSRLVEKAAQFGVTLRPIIHKLAGFTITSTKDLKDWLGARAAATEVPEIKEAFSKLATAVGTHPREIRDRQVQIKLAETIGYLDKQAGLVTHYDRRLPDPMMTVFNTEKVAGYGVDLGGTFVPMSRLAQYPATFFGDVLGEDVVHEASDGRGGVDPHKLAAILETLPLDMKNVLARQMR